MRGLKQEVQLALSHHDQVASFTDAWIETLEDIVGLQKTLSHLLQMRGLKQLSPHILSNKRQSHLLQMRGLKLMKERLRKLLLLSHLLQMRGLKLRLLLVMMVRLRRIFYRCVD